GDSTTKDVVGLVVAFRSDELSNLEFRGKRTAVRLFSSQAVSFRIRHAQKRSPCSHPKPGPSKTAHSTAIRESDSRRNTSTYHDTSICSLKKARKLVPFLSCQTRPIPLPRCCRNASSCSTARWAQLCNASA